MTSTSSTSSNQNQCPIIKVHIIIVIILIENQSEQVYVSHQVTVQKSLSKIQNKSPITIFGNKSLHTSNRSTTYFLISWLTSHFNPSDLPNLLQCTMNTCMQTKTLPYFSYISLLCLQSKLFSFLSCDVKCITSCVPKLLRAKCQLRKPVFKQWHNVNYREMCRAGRHCQLCAISFDKGLNEMDIH